MGKDPKVGPLVCYDGAEQNLESKQGSLRLKSIQGCKTLAVKEALEISASEEFPHEGACQSSNSPVQQTQEKCGCSRLISFWQKVIHSEQDKSQADHS